MPFVLFLCSMTSGASVPYMTSISALVFQSFCLCSVTVLVALRVSLSASNTVCTQSVFTKVFGCSLCEADQPETSLLLVSFATQTQPNTLQTRFALTRWCLHVLLNDVAPSRVQLPVCEKQVNACRRALVRLPTCNGFRRCCLQLTKVVIVLFCKESHLETLPLFRIHKTCFCICPRGPFQLVGLEMVQNSPKVYTGDQ